LEPPDRLTIPACIGCGAAPQPCIGVCIWRPAQWVNAASYEAERCRALADRQAERCRALADRQAERSLTALLRMLAFTTPRTGQWERNWRALQSRARHALT
jgi:hypothetical protein